MKRINWRLVSGLLLAVVAFLSYFLFFAYFAVTRDIPWVSFLLFIAAIALLVSGWRRATRRVLASIPLVLGVLIAGMFTFMVTAGSRNLPAAASAPAPGQRAPEFALPDTNNRTVSLSGTLAQSNAVLLIFYRGHW